MNPNPTPAMNEPAFTEFDLRTPEQKAVDDEDNLKVLINTFVWQHAPGTLTLDAAEAMACKIFELFLEARKVQP